MLSKIKKIILGLKARKFRQYIITSIAATAAVAVVWWHMYKLQVQNDYDKAIAAGERIISIIQTELSRCQNTTDIILDLYKVKGVEFLEDFEPLCGALKADNIVIGSMYWAPNGVIKYAYPDLVDEATMNFEMLKDPIQGPKAIQAKESGKATIAGPHELIEGGVGFIIRKPYIDGNGNFVGFSIMVVDTDLLLQQIEKRIEKPDQVYRYSVWKNEDLTASLDTLGYMFNSDIPIRERKVCIPFYAPNDQWYLTLEPLDGWTPVRNMTDTTIICCLVLAFLLSMIYMFIHNQQIRQDMAQADAANAAKTSFLFNMSHDIRTPMNAIMGFTDLLEKHQDKPERRTDYLNKIKDSSNVLLSIINNVLEMARIEKGTLVAELKPTDVYKVNATLESVYEELARQKELDMKWEISVEHPYIYCDATKEHEIFMNIISNSIKYTPKGGHINISLTEIKSAIPQTVIYQYTISDDGIGMSEDFLPHLFDEFSRERTASYNKVEGTGLGMAIVKRLVDILEGTVEVESRKGQGTKFIVTIPHPIATNEEVTEMTVANLQRLSQSGKRVLLAEDNDLNAEIAIELLSEVGFEVDRVTDGKECLEALLGAEPNHYQLILMDIQMPRMNGYEAAAAIRTISDNTMAAIPILAMTANAFEEDRKEAINSGMNGHIAKPINVPELMKEIARVLE